KAPSEAKRVLRIDPGMAFGTGTHETTQLAAQILSDLAAKQPLVSVLDVGTGTGILALLAELLGAEVVQATEIDSEARRVARENLVRNASRSVVVLEDQLESLSNTFQVVMANIIDGVLLELGADLCRRVKPGGHLIL